MLLNDLAATPLVTCAGRPKYEFGLLLPSKTKQAEIPLQTMQLLSTLNETLVGLDLSAIIHDCANPNIGVWSEAALSQTQGCAPSCNNRHSSVPRLRIRCWT